MSLGAKDVCLNDIIEAMECLNEDSEHPVANVFQKNDATLKSDADHQLLLKIQFRAPVKLSHLKFTGVDEDSCPSQVKIFSNQPHIGFSDAEDGAPDQEFELGVAENNVSDGGSSPAGANGGPGGNLVPLKFVKFQNVTQLSIFVGENCGNEEFTQLKRLGIYGQTAENTVIADWARARAEAKPAVELFCSGQAVLLCFIWLCTWRRSVSL